MFGPTDTMSSGNARINKLNKYFQLVLSGSQELKTIKNAELFIEALCAQPDPSECADRLKSSSNGMKSLQVSLRINTTLEFLNGSANDLLKYFQHSDLKVVYGGELLRDILQQIVNPPLFWNPFVKAFKDRMLDVQAQKSFGWLLSELISLPSHHAEIYYKLAQDKEIQNNLLESSEFDTRTLGHKIKQILSNLTSQTKFDADYHPGGRHDNDFPDFRKISILPTSDELTSTEEPFLRIAEEVDKSDRNTRLATHLDNQFRLLREDLIGEIREELHIALKLKKGYHKGIVVEGFDYAGIGIGTPDKLKPWGYKVKCKGNIGKLSKYSGKKRKEFLTSQMGKNILKHQSLACLIVDGEPVAFPTILRDEDLLAETPPTIILRFTEKSTAKALLKMKMTNSPIKLVQIDTAVFSFEPVLRRLQEIRELQLGDELLCWNQGQDPQEAKSPPNYIIGRIKENPENLQTVVKLSKPVQLDASQLSSLMMGLTQRVSLIQGPPGTYFLI
jgi:hypothetical protein